MMAVIVFVCQPVGSYSHAERDGNGNGGAEGESDYMHLPQD